MYTVEELNGWSQALSDYAVYDTAGARIATCATESDAHTIAAALNAVAPGGPVDKVKEGAMDTLDLIESEGYDTGMGGPLSDLRQALAALDAAEVAP